MPREKQLPVFAKFTAAEEAAVETIVSRAMKLYRTAGIFDADRLALRMNLSAAHATCPLDLPKLAAADDFDLMHDVNGIARHLSRETGEIGGCFMPRCAR